jgi:Recombination endonuclease VII
VNKTCNRCLDEKPLSSFYRAKRMKDGYRNDCKDCFNDWHNAYSRERSKNPEIAETRREKAKAYREKKPEVSREWALLRKFNITLSEYNAILEAQGGVCAICGEPERSRRKSYLAVDHCHETGKVRGLLCNQCNVGLGALGDSIEGIEAALNYLKGLPSW